MEAAQIRCHLFAILTVSEALEDGAYSRMVDGDLR